MELYVPTLHTKSHQRFQHQHGLPVSPIATVGGYTSLESAGVSPDRLGKYRSQPNLDSSADLAHTHISRKSHSSFSCFVCCSRIY